MNISGIGMISNYLKNMELNQKWQERKSDPNKKKSNETEMDREIARMRDWAEDQQRSQAISSIHGKMLSGMELTQKEMDYLRENNPEMYDKAVKIKKEREEYKKELENCKSKEDVEKLNQRNLNMLASEVKAISGNPNIPQGKKIELLEFISMRVNALSREHGKFISSKEYQELPDKSDSKGDDSQIDVVSDSIETEIQIENFDPLKLINDLLNEAGLSTETENENSGYSAAKGSVDIWA